MAVGGIHHQHINPRANQRLHALISVRTGAHRRADPQLPEAIFTRMGERLCFVEIFNRNKAFQAKVVVHDKNFLDAVLM